MIPCDRLEAREKIQQAASVTFLTGAGVSTPSGIPDYRSLQGVYQGIEAPEYLLSTVCLDREPQKFYDFVMQLYHPEAQPNVIHQKMAQLSQETTVHIVTQNIDGLHEKAGSSHCTNFHGTLYQCSCRRCGQEVAWSEYLQSDRHQDCDGQLRPDIVLYGEGFTDTVLTQAINAVSQADLLVIAGTSFQVHPFCDLIHYKKETAEILVINQTMIHLPCPYYFVQEDASRVFKEL
ncbi:NAD-dependent protein deacylase [Enterococcus olivae]